VSVVSRRAGGERPDLGALRAALAGAESALAAIGPPSVAALRAVADELEAVDEALTVGTLPDYAVVAPKDLVATIKIIPFAVPGKMLSVAEALLRQSTSPLTLHPFHHLRVGLVATELPGLKDSTTDKTIAVTEQRVIGLTGALLPPLRCAHEADAVSAALRRKR